MTSVGGFICCVDGGPTAWESKKQVDQALSSVESEYMALFRAIREVVWQRRLLAELGEEQQGPTPLYCDSQGAIALAKNPVLHGLTKHMKVKWHWVRSMVTAGEVELHYVKTTAQPADMMTKRLRQFWLTQPELEELRKQLDYLLEKKKIIRTSSSPFAPPILFTPKKGDGYRMGTDYIALNSVTNKSRCPIPCADELIDQLRKARFFSKIYLRGGDHQIRVVVADCHKIVFRTRYGSFEYVVLPFGLTNAPATFQMSMNQIFCSLVDNCVIVYRDDILIYSETRELHLKDLEA
ncbi:hypothetical protein CLOP_g17602 [Closterium sp. NIES-67]|nr:hypothetical protein CLOP_g17602 [Closterium sp. NIES-67]